MQHDDSVKNSKERENPARIAMRYFYTGCVQSGMAFET